MCGICGFTGQKNTAVLHQMGNLIQHRGPDGEGYLEECGINLCSRRLSIVDIKGGTQPMKSADSSISCVWNGELYNHVSLRHELENKGETFFSSSDTEVLVHLFQRFGTSFLSHVNGMFAIAFWEKNKNRLTLIRDRMGVKPLYYYEKNGTLIFASEIKSILSHPLYEKKINYEALYHYFTFGTVCSPDTIFSGIKTLLPGHFLQYHDGRLSDTCYWAPPFSCDAFVTMPSFEESVDMVRSLLQSAVSLRLNADVPVGLFLSGGLDSSLIAALSVASAPHIPAYSLHPITQKSSGLYHKDADVRQALDFAKTLSLPHETFPLSAHTFANALPAIIRSFDQPFSASFSTFFLAKSVRPHVHCLLTGDGADELFGSYYIHQLSTPFSLYCQNRMHGLFPHEIQKNLLSPFETRLDLLEHLYQSTHGNEAGLFYQVLGITDPLKQLFLCDDIFHTFSTESKIQQYFDSLTATTPLNRMLQFQFMHQLPDQVLCYSDALSMANSVELRSPFLDYRLVEYVCALPDSYKIQFGRTKHLLKEAARNYLPATIIDRKKEGFVPPVRDWMQCELRDFVTDTLSVSALKRFHFLQPEMVQFLLQQFYSGSHNSDTLGELIFSIVCFQIWCEQYV